MTFSALLDHRVHIVRRVDGVDDSYGQPTQTDEIGETFAAAIQPKSVREVVAISQAGAAIGDYTIFLAPRLLTEADVIVHDTATCPKPDVADFADCRFEVTGVRNAAGIGHHLEVDVRLTGASGGVEGS